jgi:6-phosphogluconolactonase/glucosamine-6-phosphate isomerase/deaminase
MSAEHPELNKEQHRPDVRRFPNPEKAQEEAGKYLADLLKKYKDSKILLLVSGGSSLALLDHALPKEGREEDWNPMSVTVAPLDERWEDPAKGPVGDASNYAALTHTEFYQRLREASAPSIDTTQQEDESFEDFSHRIDNQMEEWLPLVDVIIITQGIGSDGHTAGMLPIPDNEKLFNDMFNGPTDNIMGNPFPDKNGYYRLTATMKLLRRVDHAVVYAVGEKEKGEALRNALDESKKIPLEVLPAGILKEMKDVVVFTDIPEQTP